MSATPTGRMKVGGGAAALLLLLAVGLSGASKKLEVSALSADVHKQPDLSSSVIATLSRGEILILASTRKFKKEWNYVYFPSQKSGALKSGYVRDSEVSKLYVNTRSVTFSSGGAVNGSSRLKPQASSNTVHWGMSSADLTRLIGDPVGVQSLSGGKVLRYKRRVMERDCRIEYEFYRDRLEKTRYLFTQDHPQHSLYIEDFQQLNTQFTRQYGKPAEESKLWHEPTWKDDPNRWGHAVSLGHLSYRTCWRMDQTEVTLSLAGSDSQVSLELLYSASRLP
jgi:hypothetical protein